MRLEKCTHPLINQIHNRVDSIELLKLVGNTPLYKLAVDTEGADIYIKLEGNNPGGSIKDRAAWGMLRRAENRGELKSNTILVEPTSGNTGIGLALLGRALGLKVILTMPESMSIERRTILKSYGAEIILTPAIEGMQGAIEEAINILRTKKNTIMLDQFSNLGNSWAHEKTTGPEIVKQMPKNKEVVAFVSGFGTGGTITGVGKVLLKKYPKIEIVAIEPASSPLITKGHFGPHKIQGIGANFMPKILDTRVVSRFMTVKDEDAINTAKKLAAEEGIFSGISTGANVWAAIEIARKLPKNTAVVTIQPDRGDKYLSIYAEE